MKSGEINRRMMIKTERIKIYPASREQMERIIQAEKDGNRGCEPGNKMGI
jgi:hypothetical protein